MQTRRLTLAALATLGVLLCSACVPPPAFFNLYSDPSRELPPPPPETSTSPDPVAEELDPDPEFLPDTPVPASDSDFEFDTGELYAGEPGITNSNLSPDGGIDVVLEPTFGEPSPGLDIPVTPIGEAYPEPVSSPSEDLLRSTVGQLVMTDSAGEQYVCTATVINSRSNNIAITAAHCIYNDKTQRMFEHIEFWPGRDGENDPYGSWVAEETWIPLQYRASSQRWAIDKEERSWLGFDFGFIRFDSNDDGEEIEEVTGGQGVTFTAQVESVVTAGYPGNEPFPGDELILCADDRVQYGVGGGAHYSINCTMGRGASGSGLITYFDDDANSGYIAAVLSTATERKVTGAPLGGTAYAGFLSLQE
ncbi:trypsin-like serine peptidase [Humidisolicoccus flavus]|uniref:trypsin-like serine peptidase n=1 Tax=Humidisolicoccus flavus TaxID=3111414 RepID=UPI0032494088